MGASAETVAEALLLRLGAAGVPYLFANSGTDAAPLIEAYARLEEHDLGPVPEPVVVAHEMAAVSIAHGYAMTSGRPAAVFVHVTVGTANATAGIMNASRQRVPIVVLAGRTPVRDDGTPGSRDLYIHWAQESFDQASMVREYTRWDYELRDARQVDAVVDRALAVATSDPSGPVYLSLPRELLASPAAPAGGGSGAGRFDTGSLTRADVGALARAADLVAAAASPLVITNSLGRDTGAVDALRRFTEASGAGVVETFRERLSFPASHPQHLGFDVSAQLGDADLVIVAEADVPWLPSAAPATGVPSIHLGLDPLHRTYPMWSFPVDVALPGDPTSTLHALTDALGSRIDAGRLAARLAGLAAQHDVHLRESKERAEAAASDVPISAAYLSRCIGDLVDSDALVVNEYDVHSDQLRLDEPGSFYSSPSVSGLGWGFGAAIGAKVGAPERTVVCGLGDGAYIFSNPVACHMAAELLDAPVLVVVFNNGRWNAVADSARRLAPDGWAVRTDNFPLTELAPVPSYAGIAAACGAYSEEVDAPGDLLAALERTLKYVQEERRVALLDVRCA